MTASPIDFHDSILLISARSPFARRVRVAFQEHGVRYTEQVLDVFKPTAELIEANPLARVPTLQLPGGKGVLVDSNLILQAFYQSMPSSPFVAKQSEDRVTCLFWSSQAVGMAEKLVEYYIEKLRPEALRDAETLAEGEGIFHRVLKRFDAFIGTRETISPAGLTQADFDMAITLAYASLRYTPEWMNQYLNAARFFRNLDRRPSFEKTRPPA